MFVILTIFYFIIGIVGFYFDSFILMLIANTLLVLENLRGFFTGQVKSLSGVFTCIFIGILISLVFNISWIKGITIVFCFGTAILYIGSIILSMIFKENKMNEI